MNLLHLLRLSLGPAADGTVGKFDLLVTNLGGKSVRLGLTPTGNTDRISIQVQREITIDGGSEIHVPVSVSPLKPRHWGPDQTVPFTMTATNLDDPMAEPVSADSEYLDVADRTQIYTIAAVFVAAALLTGAVIVFLFVGHGSKSKSHAAAADTGPAYTFKADLKGLANVRTAPAFLCYHLEPQSVPYHVRLALTAGTRSDTLAEWDDNGDHGGDCLYIAPVAPVDAGKMSLEAWVEGKKVGQADLGALTP